MKCASAVFTWPMMSVLFTLSLGTLGHLMPVLSLTKLSYHSLQTLVVKPFAPSGITDLQLALASPTNRPRGSERLSLKLVIR